MAAAVTVSGGLGELLRATREARGHDLDEVAERLELPRRYLEALESERFDAIGGDFFAQGYLRLYALYLRLDPDELVGAYLSGEPPARPDAPAEPEAVGDAAATEPEPEPAPPPQPEPEPEPTPEPEPPPQPGPEPVSSPEPAPAMEPLTFPRAALPERPHSAIYTPRRAVATQTGGIGAVLRAARLEQGWQLGQAAEGTGLDEGHLAAMESEHFEVFSGPVAVKANVRCYARWLGIDPEPLLSGYVTEAPPDEVVLESWADVAPHPSEGRLPVPVRVALLLAVIAAAAVAVVLLVR